MSNIDQFIPKGDTFIYEGKVHEKYIVPRYTSLVLATGATFLPLISILLRSIGEGEIDDDISVGGIFPMVLFLPWFIYALYSYSRRRKYLSSSLILTDKRCILVGFGVYDVTLDKCEGISVFCDRYGQQYGYATVRIDSPGGPLILDGMEAPYVFRDKFIETKDLYLKKNE